MPVWHTAVLGLGSNIGRSEEILRAAWSGLQDVAGIKPGPLSSPYRSKPVDMESCHWFVNAVGIVRTTFSPFVLLHTLQSIEARFGRCRDPQACGFQDRTLDLDFLLYDDIVLETAELIIPHPRMHQRRFVLEPLLEIAEGIVLSPFVPTLPIWAHGCLVGMANQQVERRSWKEL